jgi:hypothetical protein
VGGVGEHGFPELGLEVVEPPHGELVAHPLIGAGGVEERLPGEEPQLRVGEHRPVVAPLRQDDRADPWLLDPTSVPESAGRAVAPALPTGLSRAEPPARIPGPTDIARRRPGEWERLLTWPT